MAFLRVNAEPLRSTRLARAFTRHADFPWVFHRTMIGGERNSKQVMDSIEFLLIVVVFAVILIWYLRNAEARSEGLIGLLALKDDPVAAKPGRRAYRLKTRTARKPAGLRDSREAKNQTVTYTQKGESDLMRRRFRRQDEARYRVKDKAAKFKPAKRTSPKGGDASQDD